MFLKFFSFTFVKIEEYFFVLVRMNSANLRGKNQRLNFTKKHTLEGEDDGNGEIQNTNQMKMTPA